MMYLKIMGSENLPDHDSSKPHTLMAVTEYSTHIGVDDDDLYIAYSKNGHAHTSRVFSNIYVMNADGKTINSITPKPSVPQTIADHPA